MAKREPDQYPKMVYVNGVPFTAKSAEEEYLLTHPEAAAAQAARDKIAADAETERAEQAAEAEAQRVADEERKAAEARDQLAAEAEAALAAGVKQQEAERKAQLEADAKRLQELAESADATTKAETKRASRAKLTPEEQAALDETERLAGLPKGHRGQDPEVEAEAKRTQGRK